MAVFPQEGEFNTAPLGDKTVAKTEVQEGEMSKSGAAFEKLTYDEIRSMTLKEVGEWLYNGMDINGDKWTLVERIKGYSETFKRGKMPKGRVK